MTGTPLTIDSTAKLNSGQAMPLLGFGTFQIPDGPECVTAVRAAIEAGYRHIDTAVMYDNEASVGQAIREASVPREELFITSKLPHSNFATDKARETTRASLDRLGLEYMDLYLLHWPIDETMMDGWAVLQEFRDDGAIRSIGVSNWTVARFGTFFKHTDEAPSVNQVELHPFWARGELRSYCREKGIVVEGYSPLARAEKLEHPTLLAVAERHGKSPAQVMIRWQLQQNVVVIPKSSKPERIRENADVYDFELSEQDMTALAGLDGGEAESVIDYRTGEWY